VTHDSGGSVTGKRSRTSTLVLALVTLAAAAVAAVASADSTPIGPLPAGPTSTIATRKGELVSIALPVRSGGRVWRIARTVSPRVLRQVGEADVGDAVVLVFKAVGRGHATVVLGLTKGETAKALESRRFVVRVAS
jgi:hypothetical protein